MRAGLQACALAQPRKERLRCYGAGHDTHCGSREGKPDRRRKTPCVNGHQRHRSAPISLTCILKCTAAGRFARRELFTNTVHYVPDTVTHAHSMCAPSVQERIGAHGCAMPMCPCQLTCGTSHTLSLITHTFLSAAAPALSRRPLNLCMLIRSLVMMHRPCSDCVLPVPVDHLCTKMCTAL